MADGPFRFHSGAGSLFLPPQQQLSHSNPRNPSPAHSSRLDLIHDAASPTRSPGRRASPHNSFAMNNHHSQFSQNVFLNNGHGGHQRFGMPLSSSKTFQNSSHHGHHSQHHTHRQQQDHAGHGNFSSHQHNSSSGGFSAGTPHFTSTQLRNGTPGHSQNGLGRPPNEQWAQQLTLYQMSREATGTHPHARNSNMTKALQSIEAETSKRDVDREERNRAVIKTEASEQLWLQMDMGGQGLRALSPALFRYNFLTKLYLNSNNLSFLPAAIGRLKNLEELDVSLNLLVHLPPEIGMLVNLKSLLLFDNQLRDLPPDLGSLFKLEMLGIEGNPLAEDLKTLMIEEGTKATIATLREQGIALAPPEFDREWRKVDESTKNADAERLTVLSYNMLCDKYATESQYGYTPQAVLAWENRKHVLLSELREHNADVMCLQEVDGENYNEFFRPMLAENGYRGFFHPKSRSRTMPDKDAKRVDGCVTFWKHNKFVCLDKRGIDINSTATNHPDMKGSADVYNRVMPRDDVATVTFLEQRQTGSRFMIGNIHIYWDPRYSDVKTVQAAVVIDQITKQARSWVKQPACTDKALFRYSELEGEGEEKEPLPEPGPSKEYKDVADIPFVMCGDFNSQPGSGVYELFSTGELAGSHDDFQGLNYGNFTKDGLKHPFALKSAYGTIGELPFTNYVPTFLGVLDYIWYSTPSLQVTSLLGPVDEMYMSRVPGFPNAHFPSDHLPLLSEFVVKTKKERQVVQPDFGPQKK